MKKKDCFVITGAGRGLGRDLAKRAYLQGYPVALLARTESDLKSLKDELDSLKLNQRTTIHQVDLSQSSLAEKAMQEVLSEHGKIEVLVNNAATWTGGTEIRGLSLEDLQKSLDLNFMSAYQCTKVALDQFEEEKNLPLSIVNIGATASTRGGAKVFAFAAAKSLLRIFSQSLAREMGPKGVHVAHVIVDGLLNNERTKKLNPQKKPHEYIELKSLSEDILRIVAQERDCWTFEWDARPYCEKW